MDQKTQEKKTAVESIAKTLSVSLVETIPHASFPLLTCVFDRELELLRGGGKKGKGKTVTEELEDEDPLETFSRENIRPAAMTMFPADVEKLRSISGQLRHLVSKYYLAGKFVNVVFLDEILEQSQELIENFNQQVTSMCDRWDDEAKRFNDLSWDWLSSLSSLTQEKRRQFHLRITGQIPSKEEFRSRCKLHLELRPVPAPTQPQASFSDKVNNLIDDGWQNQMVELGRQAVVNCLQSAYDTANAVLSTCLKGREPCVKQRNRMASLAASLPKNNLFSNPLITKIGGIFQRIASGYSAGEELEDELTAILLDIWTYRKDSGEDIDMKSCVFTKAEFESMLEMHAAQEKLAGV